MRIQPAEDSDLEDVLLVERAAFGSDIEASLVRGLLRDSSAQPAVSLLAFREQQPIGHILFTRATLEPAVSLSLSILAPLAVVPDDQKQGVGGELIGCGLQRLTEMGVDLVFVLGHPAYYPKFGFKPAGKLGFEAPYPIPDRNADAWMVQALRGGVIGNYRGRVICADTLHKPEYWRE